MKRVIPVFLAVLIVGQSLTSIGLVVYYNLNKQYIAAKLCKNRANPGLHCNGKCYLSEQLKKAEEKEQKQAAGFFKEKEECAFHEFTENIAPIRLHVQQSRIKEQSFVPARGFLSPIVKPPTV